MTKLRTLVLSLIGLWLIPVGIFFLGLAIVDWEENWFFSLATIGLSIAAVMLAGYYTVFSLAKADIVWTIVEQGWCKIVLVWGEYKKTIGPGLRLIGIPGTRSLYRRKMTFFKSVTDKGIPRAEPHEDEDISSFKTIDYAYAFPFKDEEDSHALPLSGMLAVIAVIEDYEKAFFAVSDWYSMLNTEIMPCFRGILVRVSYDDDIVGRDEEKERELTTLSVLLWEKLNLRENGNDSILERLLNLYGIKIKSVYLRSIDPPPDWRATTLAPYKAEREKEAAKHHAETSAFLLDDTNQALQAWMKSNPNATKEEIAAKQKELHERAILKAGGQQLHIKGLENANTAVVGGGGTGGTGILVGNSGGGGKNKNKGREEKDVEEIKRKYREEYERQQKEGKK